MSKVETMERKKPRPRRSFTPEFKAEIVERCLAGDRSIGQVARDFDLTETAVRAWVHQAEVDGGEREGCTRPRDTGRVQRRRQQGRPLHHQRQEQRYDRGRDLRLEEAHGSPADEAGACCG